MTGGFLRNHGVVILPNGSGDDMVVLVHSCCLLRFNRYQGPSTHTTVFQLLTSVGLCRGRVQELLG
jgi:hypothetical protein